MNLQPLGNRILVKVILPEMTTESGLLVKPVSKNDSNRGIVEALGEGVLLDDGTYKPIALNVGDEVIFPPNSGMLLKEGSEDYRLLSVRDVLGRFLED